MSLAAVPAYLGQDFKEASPGLRFGLLLAIWTDRQDQEQEVEKRARAKSKEGQEVAEMLKRLGMDATIRELRQRKRNPLPGLWEKNDFNARKAWDKVCKLTQADRGRMQALSARQRVLAQTVPADALLTIEATATAPFTTGLGNEHPLENGFAFLNPYGLPYLPGSGVKGVLRQAARELASGARGETYGFSNEKTYSLQVGKDKVALSVIDALFGLETEEGEKNHVRGALSFWDVIPQIKGDRLLVEIMTPHQAHYYQEERERKSGDSLTPHDSGQPNPISFLTVPPGSGFTFHVVCDRAHLQRIASPLAEDDRWKAMIKAAFRHAFRWLGFGAKTAVGYGAMSQEGEPALQASDMTWPNATLRFNPGSQEIVASFEGKSTAGLGGEQASEFLRQLGERAEQLKKKKELKGVAVRVEQTGNQFLLKGLA